MERLIAASSAACALALLAAGPGTRLGWWDFHLGFSMLRWSAYLGFASAGAAFLRSGWRSRQMDGPSRALAFAGLAGLLTGAVPWGLLRYAKGAPPIHDLTTDVKDPPAFKAMLPLRKDAPNPAAYGGPEIAAQQQAAYPDLAPAKLDLAPDKAFDRAVAAAKARGWELVEAAPKAGRLEATATTFWFGFKDDIVVRVRKDGKGSRVDVRSVSRVGKGDAGANAKRIRAFLKTL